MCLAGQVLHCRMPPEAICRGSRCGDFQTDRWRRSLWRGNGRHFSYQDLSLDKAYIIGFSLKDNLKNLPETKERDKYPIQEEEIAHIPILWCHASCLTQGRFQQRQTMMTVMPTLLRSPLPSHLPTWRPSTPGAAGSPAGPVSAAKHDA